LTLFRTALRLGRVGAILSAFVGAATAVAQPLAYAQLAGNTPADRAIFAQQMTLLGQQLLYLLPAPAALDTMGGWVEWRALGFLPVFLAVWAVMAATGAGRADEDRGLVEHWLASGIGRWRYLVTRSVAFAALGVVIIAIVVAAAELASIAANEAVPLGPLALQATGLLGVLLCCYGLALLAAQLVSTRRGAIGVAVAVIGILYAIDVSARTGGAEAIRWLSPFWLYEQDRALLPGGTIDLAGTIALYAVAIVGVALSSVAFARRDLGSALFRARAADRPPATTPSKDPLLRVPVLALLDQQRMSLLVWAVGMAVTALFFLSFARTLVDTMLATPSFRVYLERVGLVTYTAFIGVVWLSTLVLLMSLYAIAQANGWAADDAEGRLEVVLAQPVSRSRVVLERLGALVVGAGVIVLTSAVAVIVGASAAGIEVEPGMLFLGTALTVAVAFAFGGLGAAGVSWRPRIAVVALGIVAIASYFLQELGPLFSWPDWVTNLSLYALYGQPLSGTIDWAKEGSLVAIGVVGAALALFAMRRRDVGT
jgi:putative exporter of polyketide antibiotics